MAKRKFEEVHNFDEVEKGMASASVYGVLTSLSPVKKGRKQNYFEGKDNKPITFLPSTKKRSSVMAVANCGL